MSWCFNPSVCTEQETVENGQSPPPGSEHSPKSESFRSHLNALATEYVCLENEVLELRARFCLSSKDLWWDSLDSQGSKHDIQQAVSATDVDLAVSEFEEPLPFTAAVDHSHSHLTSLPRKSALHCSPTGSRRHLTFVGDAVEREHRVQGQEEANGSWDGRGSLFAVDAQEATTRKSEPSKVETRQLRISFEEDLNGRPSIVDFSPDGLSMQNGRKSEALSPEMQSMAMAASLSRQDDRRQSIASQFNHKESDWPCRFSEGDAHGAALKVARQASQVIPAWYDPDAKPANAPTQGGWAPDSPETHEEVTGCCVISPVSSRRLLWDISAVIVLLFDVWSTPFGLVYITDKGLPFILKALSHFVTFFFSLDICLNFFTAYIDKDVIICGRLSIMKNYLRHWFILDFMATVPWDILLESLIGGELLSTIRIAKGTKFLKTLKLLNVLRALRTIKRAGRAWQFAGGVDLSVVLLPMEAFIGLSLLSHFNGILWTAMLPDWEASDNVSEALLQYYRSFWWAFTVLSGGSGIGWPVTASTPAMLALDIFITSQRLCLLALGLVFLQFKIMTKLSDLAHYTRLCDLSMRYLQRKKVSVETQIQVMFSLRETRNARQMQLCVQEVMHEHLPQELYRSICAELFCLPLMSLGLIMHVAHWNDTFAVELAMLVCEEVFATKTIIFKDGDTSHAAYMVMDGRLGIGGPMIPKGIADFTAGMWLGEKALINPYLRRSGTAFSKSLSCLLTVSGESFHGLLSKLTLLEDFKQFCRDQLWRGLCGRCGVLGDHFTHNCPMVASRKHSGSKSRLDLGSDSFAAGKQKFGEAKGDGKHFRNHNGLLPTSWTMKARTEANRLAKDLGMFLCDQKLEWLTEDLVKVGVNKLEDLQDLELDILRALLAQREDALTEEEEEALSPDAIAKFKDAMRAHAGGMLFTDVNQEQHLIFLSHFKQEAGTEAALMRSELENLTQNDNNSLAKKFISPFFLDSEDLVTLNALQTRVRASHNMVLLLTKNVLSRPWCLIEIVTAIEAGVRVLPVLLLKGFNDFEFPDEAFYADLHAKKVLDESGLQQLEDSKVTVEQVEASIREVMQRIAIPYSPHRAEVIRKAELQALLRQCRIKRTYMPGRNTH